MVVLGPKRHFPTCIPGEEGSGNLDKAVACDCDWTSEVYATWTEAILDYEAHVNPTIAGQFSGFDC